MRITHLPPTTAWKRRLPPPEVEKELVSLSRQGARAYYCGIGGMATAATGAGLAAAGLWRHSSRMFTLGAGLAALGASAVPLALLTLGRATLRAEELERSGR